MKHHFIFLLVTYFIVACNSNTRKEAELLQKENELLKKELEIEKMRNEIELEAKKEPSKDIQKNENVPVQNNKPSKEERISTDINTLFNLLKNEIGSSTFDSRGNFSIDTGSASSGRVQGNLKDVNLSIQYLPERPGCADICPEMAVINFKCKYDTNCIKDPLISNYSGNESSISFMGLDTGKKVFELLSSIQKNL